MSFEYFYGHQANMFSFYRIPTKQPPKQEEAATKPQLVIDLNKISHLFPAGYSVKQMELQIINMLTDYARQRGFQERHTEIEH